MHAGAGVIAINSSGGGPVTTCVHAGARPSMLWWWWRSCCSVHAGAGVVAVGGSGGGRVTMCMWAGAGLLTPVVVMVVTVCGHAGRHWVVDASGGGCSVHVGAGVVAVYADNGGCGGCATGCMRVCMLELGLSVVVVVSQHACVLIVVIVVCPCSGTGCPGTSLSLPSVLAA